MTIRIFLLIFLLKFIDSIQIGRINYASVATSTDIISTSDPTCSNCLCNCLTDNNSINSNSSTCYGINCFPSNFSCQRIEQAWIQETQISLDTTSDQFINSIDLNFCSCYSSQNILNNYENVTPISISHPMTRYITYNANDDTLLVLGDNLIGQYFASNLTRFRSWSVPTVPVAALIDTNHIYITFYGNASVNQYSKNMNYILSIARPVLSPNYGVLYDIARWRNLLFISDQQFSVIWSIDLQTMNMSIYLNLASYNISPFNVAVFSHSLYITQLSLPTIYIFDLITLTMRNITFPNSIPLYRLQNDPFCNRFWFGTKSTSYTSVPVFDLNTNKAQIYQAKGFLRSSTVYIVAFDANYSMYTSTINTNYFFKYQLPNKLC